MSVIIRFFDCNSNTVREEFLCYIHCGKGLSGEALANQLVARLKVLGLDVKDNCRGQGYDGAGNVAGRINSLY